MSLPRLEYATRIADQLNELAAVVKTRSRGNLGDACHILETIAKRFFNALYGWELVNLNSEQAMFPAADLGDRKRRIAIQITVQDNSDKITRTADTAKKYELGKDFDRLIVFFLLPEKPNFPKKFEQPSSGPKIETQDINDLLKQLKELDDLVVLTSADKVLNEELGKLQKTKGGGIAFFVSLILLVVFIVGIVAWFRSQNVHKLWLPPELPAGCKFISIVSGYGESTNPIGEKGGNVQLLATAVQDPSGAWRAVPVIGGHVTGNRFFADVTIPGDFPFGQFKLSGTNIDGHLPSLWDMNFDAGAIEIVDNNQVPIYQIIYKRADVIEVYGLFMAGNRISIVSKQGTKTVPTMTTNGPTRIDGRVLGLRRIFKYPASTYSGVRIQYND